MLQRLAMLTRRKQKCGSYDGQCSDNSVDQGQQGPPLSTKLSGSLVCSWGGFWYACQCARPVGSVARHVWSSGERNGALKKQRTAIPTLCNMIGPVASIWRRMENRRMVYTTEWVYAEQFRV